MPRFKQPNLTAGMPISPFIRAAAVSLSLILAAITFHGAVADTTAPVDIHSAEVVLADNTAASRLDAFKQALAKVLVKLSGSRGVVAEPAGEAILNSAQRYVQAYNRRKAVLDDATDADSATVLHVEFDGAALERALLDAGLPVWSGTRPSVLAWLAVEDRNRRYILAENSDSALIQALQHAAEERGITVILPLMDQVDRRQVEFIDIRGGFTDRLRQAAERYNTSTLLIGALRNNGNDNWQAKWSLVQDGERSDWTDSGLALEPLMQSGIDGLADWLASRYAFVVAPGGGPSEAILSVDQVTDLRRYAEVLAALKKPVFVEGVTPIEVNGAEVRYRLRMRGTLQELQRALTSGGLLQERTMATPTSPVDLSRSAGGTPDSTGQKARRDGVDLYFTLRS